MEFRNLDQEKSFMKKEAKRLGITPMATYTTYYARSLNKQWRFSSKGKF